MTGPVFVDTTFFVYLHDVTATDAGTGARRSRALINK